MIREHDGTSNSPEVAPNTLDDVRVLVIFGGIVMHGQEWGNLEVFLNLMPRGMKVRFITNRRWRHQQVQPLLDRLCIPCGATGLFGPIVRKRALVRDLVVLLHRCIVSNWALWNEVRDFRPTHLYCMNFLYFINVSPLIFLLRTPVVFRLGDAPPGPYRLWKWLWRRIVARCETVVCVSEYIRSLAIESGCAHHKARVIYSNPRASYETAPSPAPASREGGPVVLFVGQVAEHKGVLPLLEGFAALRATHRVASLWLAGHLPEPEDPFRQKLDALLARPDIGPGVEFLGYVEDVGHLYASATLHVCPTVTDEPLPNVVLEAKRAGLPSVVFPSGGIPELIEHRVDGFVCDERSAGALLKGMQHFLDDPASLRSAGIAARRSLHDKFGRERFVNEWTEVFRRSA